MAGKEDSIDVMFLCQDCQSAETMAERLARFIRTATKTIDICIYSFHLCPGPRDIVLQALHERRRAGVKIRIAYDAGTHQDMYDEIGGDICDVNTPNFVTDLGFPARMIEGYRTLMHNKYIVIDAGTPAAKVWTGSANFTDESWTMQENNILILHSPELATYYSHDFNEFWEDANVADKDSIDSPEVTLQYKGEPARVTVSFSPIEGEWIDDHIAGLVAQTQRQATLAFVVLTSGDIIEAYQGLMRRNITIEGIYDRSQMEGVKYQWKTVPDNHWKITAFEDLVGYGQLVGKHSTPYTPQSIHDYMHNKVMVLDDLVITGSYNFSRHAQRNAENVVIIRSAALARDYREYIHTLMRRYAVQPASSRSAAQPEEKAQPTPKP